MESKISVGDTFDVSIETVGKKGDGLAKVDGFVIFIPGVNEGDKVKVKINKVLTNVAFGEVVGEGSESKEKVETEETPSAPEAPVVEDSEDFGEEEKE